MRTRLEPPQVPENESRRRYLEHNSLCAMGSFAPKVGWTWISHLHPKIDHSSGVHGWILVLRVLLAQLFDADPFGITTGSRKFVSDEFWSSQGPAWRPDFSQTCIFARFFPIKLCLEGFLLSILYTREMKAGIRREPFESPLEKY